MAVMAAKYRKPTTNTFQSYLCNSKVGEGDELSFSTLKFCHVHINHEKELIDYIHIINTETLPVIFV